MQCKIKLPQGIVQFPLNRATAILIIPDSLMLTSYVVYFYFYRQDELGLIEEKYDKHYENYTMFIAEATLKNEAAGYSRDEYIANRSMVEQGLHDALRLKLGGRYCSCKMPVHSLRIVCKHYNSHPLKAHLCFLNTMLQDI